MYVIYFDFFSDTSFSTWIAIILSIGSFIIAGLSYNHSKKVTYISAVTTNMVKWIEDARSNIAELIKLSSQIAHAHSGIENIKNDFNGVMALIMLRVDIEEKEFYSALMALDGIVKPLVGINRSNLEAAQRALSEAGRLMLKRIWEQIEEEAQSGYVKKKKK